MVEPQSQNPVLNWSEYETYLAQIYDSLTGNRSQVTTMKDEQGKPILDASGLPIVIVESSVDVNAYPVCNLEGGRYIVHHLRLMMNKHIAFGILERDEIADITCNSIMQPIDNMMFNLVRYGVKDVARLETEGLALFDSLYTYLTGLKEGGYRNFNKDVLTVQYVQKPNVPQQEQATGSLFAGDSKNR